MRHRETVGQRERDRERNRETDSETKRQSITLMLTTEGKVHEKIGIFLYHINMWCQ